MSRHGQSICYTDNRAPFDARALKYRRTKAYEWSKDVMQARRISSQAHVHIM